MRTVQRVAGLGTALAVILGALTGCADDDAHYGESGDNARYPAYAASSTLTTTNAASLLGESTNAQQIAGRIFPGVYTPGPQGQLIPNTDLAQTRALPGVNRQVVYTINDSANYSDGEPVTCTDFYLAFTAGKFQELFGSHLPWASQVERIECNPGSKKLSVVFIEGKGKNWRHLFGPGEVLPAHAIASQAGLDEAALVEAMDAEDTEELEKVAKVWSEGFSLEDFDPELQVGYGPYRIESVGANGEVVLEKNEEFAGDAANIAPLVVWPAGTDLSVLARRSQLLAADVVDWDGSFLERARNETPTDVDQQAGQLTEHLVLASEGVLASVDNRQALNACIDQQSVAKASSKVAGVDIPEVGEHVVSQADPARAQLSEVTQSHLGVDTARAQRLEGETIRVGYVGPDKRKAAMVEAMAESCAQAEVRIVDAAKEASQLGDVAGLSPAREPTADAFLLAVDPASAYGEVGLESTTAESLRQAEETLWEDMTSIPLAAQPRVFVTDKTVGNVSVYTGLAGIGWNMDRWRLE